ncbi:hypothetical protein B9Z19DRAFT_831985 [Tuber borchii]|uniref:Uncharacterized protein n=1 Tax=Tuber borchii TaxID=42251 RepID=A0A2T6ZVC2_TUBBO|nr:hypothetical protein B9Z19DRAFT_831985 [Tuber borchii]
MKFVEYYYYFTITTLLACLFASATSPDSFHPLSQAFVDGREKSFPSTELAFYRKRKERENGKRKDRQDEKKESKGRKDRTDSPCPAGICLLLLFDMRHSTCASGWECLVTCFLVPSIISRREGAGSVARIGNWKEK